MHIHKLSDDLIMQLHLRVKKWSPHCDTRIS